MTYQRLFVRWMACFCFIVLRLVAQDITVSDPAWFDAGSAAGDHPPEFKSKRSPEYTAAIPPTNRLGHVFVTLTLNAKGKHFALRKVASDPQLELVVSHWASEVAFRPATKSGQPVRSASWFALLCNPPSADTKGPNATPRLRAVAPAIVAPELLGSAKWGEFVWARITVDPEGIPGKIIFELPESEKYRPAAEASLRSWKFEPARRDGRACSAEVKLPFVIQTAKPRTLPVSIEEPFIGYPTEMSEKRLRGEVKVQFDVDVDGQILNPVVLDTTNGGFNQAAIRCVQKWKFEPGTENGQPVRMKMEETIVFDYPRAANAGQIPLAAREMARTLGEFFHYDVAPVLKGSLTPVYPYPLLNDE